MNPWRIKSSTRRSAFSLMEVLLALAISGIVLMLLGMAIDMQWRLFDTRRTGVEETLVARSVIRRISDDLRGAILYVPPDLEGLEAIANNPMAQAAGLGATASNGTGGTNTSGGTVASANNSNSQKSGGTQSGTTPGSAANNATPSSGNTTGAQPRTNTGTTSGGTSGSLTGGATGGTQSSSSGAAQSKPGNSTEESSDPSAEEATAAPIVGIYGGVDWLSIDVSRLPRIDEYQAALTGGNDMTPVDIPSDVKTVSYYIASPDPATADGEAPPPPTDGTAAAPILRGLVRQQLSRAITSWNELGNATDDVSNAEILAEEVTALEFGYFDGTTWYSDWDSTAMGGIPVAVALAIQVEMKRSRSGQQVAASQGEDPDVATTATIHRMVVHLPAARKVVSEEMLAAEAAEEEATAASAAASAQTGAAAVPAVLNNLGTGATGGSAPGGFPAGGNNGGQNNGGGFPGGAIGGGNNGPGGGRGQNNGGGRGGQNNGGGQNNAGSGGRGGGQNGPGGFNGGGGPNGPGGGGRGGNQGAGT